MKREKILAQNSQTTGTVVKVYKCWWLKFNTKPVRFWTMDGAWFPHIITVEYSAGGKQYTKKKWIPYHQHCPGMQDTVRVYYDETHPSRCVLNI